MIWSALGTIFFQRVSEAGDIELRTSMSYAEIYEAIINHEVKTRETVTIRFSEGSEVSDIVAKFIEKRHRHGRGLCQGDSGKRLRV